MEPIYNLPPDVRFTEVVAPFSEAADWSLGFLGIDEVHKKTAGEGVLIIILDTGVDHTHPDLINQIVSRKDFTGDFKGTFDRIGHGTHCAGTAAAEGHNNVGVISPAYKAKLACGKVLGPGGGREEWLISGIHWACDLADNYPAAVLSMSWGGPMASQGIQAALQRFVGKRRRIAVAAAGNDGPKALPGYPSVFDECLCVAANGRDGALTSFSSRSDRVDTVGPGEGIISTMPGGGYAEMSGTSMATPIVASVAACVLAADLLDKDEDVPDYKAFRAMVRATNRKIEGSSYGLMNPPALVDRVSQEAPQPKEPKLIRDLGMVQIYKPARAGDDYSINVSGGVESLLEALRDAA